MIEKSSQTKRYLLSMAPEVFSHLEQLVTQKVQATGQYVTVASLIRTAIQDAYPLPSKEPTK